jgi:hypothetical protein
MRRVSRQSRRVFRVLIVSKAMEWAVYFDSRCVPCRPGGTFSTRHKTTLHNGHGGLGLEEFAESSGQRRSLSWKGTSRGVALKQSFQTSTSL